MKNLLMKTKSIVFSAFVISLLFFTSTQSSLAFEKSVSQIVSDYKTMYSQTLKADWNDENEKLKKCFSELSESPLHTDRLIIEKTCESDIPKLAEILMNPEITEYLNATKTGPFENIEQSIQYVRQSLERSTIKFTVKLKDDLTVIGNIGYSVDPCKKQISLGYYFGKEYQGKGYAFESVSALTKKILDSIDLGKLSIFYHSKNYSSAHLAKKVINYLTANSYIYSCQFTSSVQEGIINECICRDNRILGFTTEILFIKDKIKCLSFFKNNTGVVNESCR